MHYAITEPLPISHTTQYRTQISAMRSPLHGLADVPFPQRGQGLDTCEEGFYRVVHSGQSVVEYGEQIDGAVRIPRTQIKSFDIISRVANQDGTLVFEMIDGRKFRLIDRFNARDYVIGYFVEPCPPPVPPCAPCPSGCRRETVTETYYARKQPLAGTMNIPVQINRKIVKCDNSTSAPRLTCAKEIDLIKLQHNIT